MASGSAPLRLSSHELPTQIVTTNSERRTCARIEDMEFIPKDVEAGSFFARSISGHEVTTPVGDIRMQNQGSSSGLYSPSNQSSSIWDSIYDSAQAFGKSVQDTYSQYFRETSSDNEPGACPGLLLPQNEIGFSFSPAGLLLPYHLGVMRYLCDYDIINETVPISGASAGSIAVATQALGLPTERIMQSLYRLEADLRLKGTAYRLRRLLHAELHALIPETGHKEINCRPAGAYIVYTRVRIISWYQFSQVMPWRGEVVCEFLDREDLISCILASCNIPFYFTKSPTVLCRNRHCVDGYFSDRKNFGCPALPGVRRLIRVAPFSGRQVLGHLARSDVISPDLVCYDHKIGREKLTEFRTYLARNPAPATNFTQSTSHVCGLETKDVKSTLMTRDVEESMREARESIERTRGTPAVEPTDVISKPDLERSNTLPSAKSRSIKLDKSMSLRKLSSGDREPRGSVRGRGVENGLTNPSTETIPAEGCIEVSKISKGLKSEIDQKAERLIRRQPMYFGSSSRPLELSTDPTSNPIVSRITDRENAYEDSEKNRYTPSPSDNSGFKDSRHPRNFLNSWFSAIAPKRMASDSKRRSRSERARRLSYDSRNVTRSYSAELRKAIPKTQFSLRTLFYLAVNPAENDDIIRQLYDLGRADAFRWLCLEKRRQDKRFTSGKPCSTTERELVEDDYTQKDRLKGRDFE